MKEFLKTLQYFIENPYTKIHIRELSRKLRISPSATKKYLDMLLKEEILKEEKISITRHFTANTENLAFKHFKIAWNTKILKDLRIKDQILNKEENITSIILYGSYAKGQNDEKSDIDLLVIGAKNKIRTENPKVSIQQFTWAEWKKQAHNNKAFYEEIILHGIPLHGEVPII